MSLINNFIVKTIYENTKTIYQIINHLPLLKNKIFVQKNEDSNFKEIYHEIKKINDLFSNKFHHLQNMQFIKKFAERIKYMQFFIKELSVLNREIFLLLKFTHVIYDNLNSLKINDEIKNISKIFHINMIKKNKNNNFHSNNNSNSINKNPLTEKEIKNYLKIIVEETIENSLKEIKNITNKLFSKRGEFSNFLKEISLFDKKERIPFWKIVNILKTLLNKILDDTLNELEKANTRIKFTQEKIDISIKGRPVYLGKLHPISQMIQEITQIFKNFGFNIVVGKELESEYYNFDALNIPKEHPARNEQDSFYVNSNLLLRTHTSPIQIRVMEKEKPPLSIISSGRCFRKDTLDATHHHIFHQLEGFHVDKGINFSHIKGLLQIFAQTLFGSKVKLRFRPDYFPFTTPSAEFSISCFFCGGKGCQTCKKSGFIEIAGCGLIDPKVFEYVNINSNIYSGYAFGIGIERLVMTKYKIPDIRLLYQNDIRFLKQF